MFALAMGVPFDVVGLAGDAAIVRDVSPNDLKCRGEAVTETHISELTLETQIGRAHV